MGCNREPTQEETQRIHKAASRIASEVGSNPDRAERYVRAYGVAYAKMKLQSERDAEFELNAPTTFLEFEQPNWASNSDWSVTSSEQSPFEAEMASQNFEVPHEEELGEGFHEVGEQRFRPDSEDKAAPFLEKRGVPPEEARIRKESKVVYSKILGENLVKDGWERPSGKYDAAHIVPSGHSDPNASRARELLMDADIDINSPENGFWAPSGRRGDLYGEESGTFHSETHTKKFFSEIADRLEAVSPEERKNVLNEIRNELIDGTRRPTK